MNDHEKITELEHKVEYLTRLLHEKIMIELNSLNDRLMVLEQSRLEVNVV